MGINNLADLNNFKSASVLDDDQIKNLLSEIEPKIIDADQITVGIMAFKDVEAIKALKSIF